MNSTAVLFATLAIICVHGGPISSRLQPNSPGNIRRLRNLAPADLAEELSGQFEGDIILTEAQQDEILSRKRNGRIELAYRWPSNEIPYEIVVDDFAAEQIGHIERGIRLLERQTCLRFRPRRNQTEDYIRVIGNNPSGCWSWVGNVREGMQELHLAPAELESGCFRLGTIVHEFIHAIGFFHMQSASDRDDYVEIHYDNILEGTESNFLKYSADEVTSFDVRYDYGSVMHYGGTAFSKNGLPTIVPKDPNAEIGQRIGMSERDISKINLMYRCLGKKV
ncbi:blastula protease 10-like [Toxorhynchites rutilus septentrionalis]|uniref:blastula protease 10-like n=1 Tax=Toxorhynchites rutilus septentrionalis TaxID=329112 RepID=UPI002478FB49|nr:blastula protease 10-like [Toxorhynchites rutilus septentrionalis]